MNEDAWYRSFVPGSRARSQQPQPVRRQSLLDKPQQADADIDIVGSVQHPQNESRTVPSPPSPTLVPRAKSYTEFHRITRRKVRRRDERRRRSQALEDATNYSKDETEDPSDLPESLIESSHAKYRLYRDQLRLSRRHLDSILEDTASNLNILSTLSTSFKTVEAQTSSFQSRCEGLMEEQQRQKDLADNIGYNLQYYNLLDPITRRLNAPGAGQFVRRDDFLQMLSNLDQCIDYMQAHYHHREADSYLSRYRQLLTRALTLIRVHFTESVREIAADVSKRLQERQVSDAAMSYLLSAKFRASAPELKRLGLEIQKRAVLASDAEPAAQGEYQSLMNELYQSFSAARGRLTVPVVRKRLAEIAIGPNASNDLVALARTSISYIEGICMDEYELWHEWFDGEGGLYEYLEALCEPLFDYLRPRIVHETQLTKLCELCSIIQVRYMDGQDEESEPREGSQLDFAYLIRPALEDGQTRLVFLALSMLRDDIERYKPKPADLENAKNKKVTALSKTKDGKVPILSGRKTSTNGSLPAATKSNRMNEEGVVDSIDMQWRYEDGSNYQEWYPTLRKAIWLLSRIYRLVNSTIFDDLAHQIVHQTTLSLHYAAHQVSSKQTKIDSQMFLLKQLLILKQQIVAFDIEFVAPEINFDFSNVSNTFWELRERGGLFNPRNLLRLVGGGLMPRVVENMLDAKAELDGRLRNVINEFTRGYAEHMTASISEGASAKKDFRGGSAVKVARKAIEKDVPLLRAKLEEYLDDARIRETLVGAVQDQVLQNYEGFFERITSDGTANGNAVSKKGKGREDDIWDPDTFADWLSRTCSVERGSFSRQEGSPALSRHSTSNVTE